MMMLTEIIVPHILVTDLLYDLLKYLPLKSLFRFTLVCKRWNALITKDEKFRVSVISRQNSTPAGLLIRSRGETSNLSLDYLPFSCASGNISTISPLRMLDFSIECPPRMVVQQSCNGLLLGFSGWYDGRRYYVCNLATKKVRLLPALDGKGKNDNWSAMCLAFDPPKSPYYKAVAVKQVSYHVYQIYVFSSDTGLWRISGDRFETGLWSESDERFFKYNHIDYDEGVYWNGGIHWIDYRQGESSVCFDIENGMLKTMPRLPIKSDRVENRNNIYGQHLETNKYYFGESCGNLHFIENGFMLLDIYEMKRDYSEWFIKQSIDLMEMTMGDGFGIFSIVCDKFKILSVVCGEKDDDSFLVLRVSGEIIWCDLVSKTCKRLDGVLDPQKGVFENRTRAFHYIESLCSV